MNSDGSLNADKPNEFNDLRGVFEFYKGKKPRLLDAWEGTTEPGFKYTYKPMNQAGAARIAFGQYKAWRVGTHGNSEPHEALVQAASVKVHRDANKDMVRRGDGKSSINAVRSCCKMRSSSNSACKDRFRYKLVRLES